MSVIQQRAFFSNPQALAAVSKRRSFNLHPELSEKCDRDTWMTPRWILDQLGCFDLDPCASGRPRHWVADREFTADDDGLGLEWSGRVFMNPPYSNTAPWIERHAEHGDGISLVPASVESIVWRRFVWTRAKAVLLLHGRTRFSNPDGSATLGRPLRSVALIAWAPYDVERLRASSLAGVLLEKWAQR